MERITNSPKETKQFAKEFIKDLKGGEILGLVGELGTGKTVFVQGLAEGLGVKEVVNSPTFVIIKNYQVPTIKYQGSSKLKVLNIKQLIHVDAYRLDSFEELRDVGIEDYLNKDDYLVVVEWADRVSEIRNYPNYQEIIFKEGKRENERVIIT